MWALAGLLLGAAAGALLAGLPHLARAELSARLGAIADRTGLSVHIEAVEVGLLGRIQMRDVRIDAPAGAGVSVAVAQVSTRLAVEALLAGERRLDEVRVDGLVVQLDALPPDARDALDELQRRVAALRPRSRGTGGGGGGGLEDLRVTVLDGTIRVGERPLVEHLSVTLTRPRGGLVVEARGRLGGTADVQASGRLDGGVPSGEVTVEPPIPLPGLPASVAGVALAADGTLELRGLRLLPVEKGGARGSARCDRVVVRPREGLTGLPRSLADLGEVELVAPVVEVELPVGRDELLGWAKAVARGGSGAPKAFGGLVGAPPGDPEGRPPLGAARGLATALRVRDGRLTVRGPRGEELGALEGVSAALSPSRTATTGRATARVEGLPELPITWDVALEGLAPRALSVTAEGLPVGRWLRDRASPLFTGAGTADVTATWQRGDRLPRGAVTLRGVTLESKRISPLPVVLDGVTVAPQISLPEDGKTAEVSVDLTGAEGGRARVLVKGRRLDTKPLYDVVFDIPEQDCAKVVASVPRGMLPSMADDLKVAGTLGGRIEILDLDPDRPAGLRLVTEGGWDDCRILKLPKDVQKRLKLISGRFKLEVDEGKGPIGVFVGPAVPGYLSIGAMPELLRAGPLLTEDGAHYVHKGFSRSAIEGALRLNLTKRRYAYGGSSISQQLVKNLFLHRDKTLARKLEEAVIVVAMERALDKGRIMELYLNCIEYGTKLYGIANAAQHYFRKGVGSLTPVEIAFLMHLKTSPKEAWGLAKRGSLPQRWRDAVEVRLRSFVKKGYVTQEVYEASAPYDPIGAPPPPM
ncbi:MAG: hypothetical protein AMXMBFR64_08520 [Myxococcales bacterium]